MDALQRHHMHIREAEHRQARRVAMERRAEENEGDGRCVDCSAPGEYTRELGWDRDAGAPAWAWLCGPCKEADEQAEAEFDAQCS